MTFKKQNIDKVTAINAPNRVIRDLFSAKTMDALEVTVRVVDLAPISEQGARRPHWHDGFEEVIHIVQGRGRMYLDGDWYNVETGDTVLVPPNIPHATFNLLDSPLRLMVFFPRAEIEPFYFADEYLTLDSSQGD
jgi:quercetin dioxygenase-like cupin family protein